MDEKTIVYAANSGSNDIAVFHLEQSGLLRSLGNAQAGGPASAMAVSPDGRFLHVAVKSDPPTVETFAIDPAGGALQSVSHALVPASLAYISMDEKGWFLLGAAYHSHIAAVLTVSPEGLPSAQPLAILEPGIHPHAVLVDPSNRYAFIPALGSDVMRQYIFDPLTGVLAPNTPAEVRTPTGSGPRHFRFSPDGKFVYLLTELSGDIITYAFDRNTGLLEERSSVSIIPPERPEQKDLRMWAADIQVRPDGCFVYASERTTSNLVCFRADVETGVLQYAGHMTTEEQPRGFAIDPTGKYLVAAGEKSGHVSCYRIDVDTGGLQAISRVRAGQGTNWVTISQCRRNGLE